MNVTLKPKWQNQ